MQTAAEPTSAPPGGALEGPSFLTFDTSPLQTFLRGILKQVELCQQENANLKAELQELKAGPRLDTLEQSLQELADLQKTDNGYASMPPAMVMPDTSEEKKSTAGASSTASPELVAELSMIKERMAQMERKSEALWHTQQADEELRGLVERLRGDVGTVRAEVTESSAGQRASQQTVERLNAATSAMEGHVLELQDQLAELHGSVSHHEGQRKEASSKVQHNISVVWEQVRHLENDVAAKFEKAGVTQVATQTAIKEMQAEVQLIASRYEEDAQHSSLLESRVETLRSDMTASLSPLRAGLAEISGRLDEMAALKLDSGSALTLQHVHAAVARAVAHADARADNALSSIATLEDRIEELNDLKAEKDDVVMTVDLEALLTAHAAELDTHLNTVKDEILGDVTTKADRAELADADSRLGGRISSLETAILKGLKAVSDKVAGALTTKADLAALEDFRTSVGTELREIERRLRGWNATASGQKATLDGAGGGAPTCLSCDARVRGARDLQAAGYPRDDRVFSPERLPAGEGLLPAIQKSPDIAAHHNARAAQRRRDASNLFTRSTTSLPESMPGHSGHIQSMGSRAVHAVDTGAMSAADGGSDAPKDTAAVSVDVETVNPASPSKGRSPGAKDPRSPSPGLPVAAWETGPTRPPSQAFAEESPAVSPRGRK